MLFRSEEYAGKFPDNPFISIAVHDRRIDRTHGYPIPYRCFYARNLDNLFMAGRCVSVTHEALGTVRVMKTCGMMGEVVGKAASVAVRHGTTPRGVYDRHWPELESLLGLPGKARRATPDADIELPADARSPDPATGIDPGELGHDRAAVICDDDQAILEGAWTQGESLKPHVGRGYHYARPDSAATATYRLAAPTAGRYDVLVGWQAHANRGTAVPVLVETAAGRSSVRLDMSKSPPLPGGFGSVGRVDLGAGDECVVVIATDRARGLVHADAVMLAPAR